jgi:hypothetical protein
MKTSFISTLENKPIFTGSISQCLDSAVIQKTIPIENYGSYIFPQGLTSYLSAYLFGGLDIASIFQSFFNLSAQRRRGNQSCSGCIIYYLRMNVTRAFEHIKAWSNCGTLYFFSYSFLPLYT